MRDIKDLHIAAQLFSFSPYKKNLYEFYDKLEKIKKLVDLKALMIGVNLSEDEKEVVIKKCKQLDIKTYLWYPVLADLPEHLPLDDFKSVGYGNNRESFILQTQKDSGEDFAFLCPNKEMEDNRLRLFFADILNNHDFDGVFLDKIRYPSPANGLSDMLSCRCDICRKLASDPEIFSEDILNSIVDKILTADSVKKLKEAVNFIADNLSGFMKFREDSVFNLVKRYVKIARSMNLSVGIDLFSPSLSQIVSQDYSRLCELSDWIKPMIYLKTMGPAGVPLEIYSLIKIIKSINKNIPERIIIECFEELLVMNLPVSLESFSANGIPVVNFPQEISKIHSKINSDNIKIYPGFEAVKFAPICDMSKEGIKEYLAFVKHLNLEGFVLSWDISKIPLEHFEFVSDYYKS